MNEIVIGTDRFQQLTGYQNALTNIVKRQLTLSTFVNKLREYLFGLRFYSSYNTITIHDRQKIGTLQIYNTNDIKYLCILYNNVKSADPKKRIVDGQIFGKCKLANLGMKDYNDVFKQYNWIEFLDFCHIKYEKNSFEMLCEYINFTYC